MPEARGNRLFRSGCSWFLRYESLISLLPVTQNKFADIWDIIISGESVFFRATDRLFELRNNSIQVYLPKSEWQFLKLVGKRLIAQDKFNGMFLFRNNTWIPFKKTSYFKTRSFQELLKLEGIVR